MFLQQEQNELLEDLNTDEQEPVFMTDRHGIVLLWPDQRVQYFPWSTLRQLTVQKEFLLGEVNKVVPHGCIPKEK